MENTILQSLISNIHDLANGEPIQVKMLCINVRDEVGEDVSLDEVFTVLVEKFVLRAATGYLYMGNDGDIYYIK